MNGERNVMLVVICWMTVCITVMFVVLFIALWQYREAVALSLVVVVEGVVVLMAVVYALCKLNEQWLHRQQFKHNKEMSLKNNSPRLILPSDAQTVDQQTDEHYNPFEVQSREDRRRIG